MTNEIRYKIIDSTNNEAQRQLQRGTAPKEDFVIRADFQTDGRGQRGNTWHSQNLENLTFSYVFFPKKLEVNLQFLLSQSVAIAIANHLTTCGIRDVSIKWPNDIYVGMHKICGMLIENSISGHYIKYSIIGIGININQLVFPENLPNPTSMSKITGNTYNLDIQFDSIINSIRNSLDKIGRETAAATMIEYKNLMLGLNKTLIYRSGGRVFKGIAKDVDKYGNLTVEDAENGQSQSYAFNEINLVIPEQNKENN